MHSVCSWYFPDNPYPESTGSSWWKHLFYNFERFYGENRIFNKTRTARMNDTFKSLILDTKSYQLYPDAKSVLAQCKALGFKNFILSNNFPELPDIIAQLGLADCFQSYVISSRLGYEKPRQELFSWALRTAGYPDIAYMIGDNPIADIEGGRTAGMRTILVHRNCACQADYICRELSEIPTLLSRNPEI